MEKICPLCNGLQIAISSCPRCGQLLADGGALADYWGPYSPYMDSATLQKVTAANTHCIHLLYCPECHYDVRASWKLRII